MPYTMLGIAANNSIAVPRGRLNQAGDNSVRKMAMPKLTGTAIRSAIRDVTSVPYIITSAPNCSMGGFHSAVQRNDRPNFCNDPHEA